MKFSQYSIYSALGLIVFIIITAVQVSGSVIDYYSFKNNQVRTFKEHATSTINKLQQALPSYIESYAVHSYEDIIKTEMVDESFMAIIIANDNMSMLTGNEMYVSGYIRDKEWNVIEYDPESVLHQQQLERTFLKQTVELISKNGIKVGAVSIYSSDRSLKEELYNNLVYNITSALITSLLLITVLIMTIRYFLLQPISSMVYKLEQQGSPHADKDDIPEEGSKEVVILAKQINSMLHAVRLRELQAKHALMKTVEAVAKALEARDPYTAGHQQHVSEVSTKIAMEMRLDPHRIEGIHLGAQIHDIGKLAVPVELLVKPTKLTDLEFSLIKTHAVSGVDILHGVEFPWPIAEIIVQHHERLDGSGYPKGLSGDQICLEARIVAVADVFEAMTTHRPYRAALGVDQAVKELQQYAGVRYDSEVVGALLRVLERNKHVFDW